LIRNSTGQRYWSDPGSLYLANQSNTWIGSDSEIRYQSLPAGTSIYDPHSFDYHFNELGFRCDSMIDPLQHKHRILWAGCSTTEGSGLPQDAVWCHILTQRLREQLGDQSMPYWCVASGGISMDWCLRQLSMLLPVIQPQVLVLWGPDPHRRELWFEAENPLDWVPNTGQQHARRVLDVWTPAQVVHDTAGCLSIIHQLCKLLNTELYWQIQCYTDEDHASVLLQAMRYQIPDELKGKEFWSRMRACDKARDGMHAGPLSNSEFAQALWNEIGQEIAMRLAGSAGTNTP
jgi:hypothetical protein